MDASSAIGGIDTSAVRALVGREQQAMQAPAQKAAAIAAQPMPAPPETQKAAPAPDNKEFAEGAQNYVTALSVFAGLAGVFSRQHATTALNAFGAGIKGYTEGNKQALDEAHKEWEENNKAMQENNKALTDKYNEILENRKLSEQEQINQINVIAAQYHDPIMLESHSIDLKAKIMEIREQAANRLQMASIHMQERKDLFDYEHKQNTEAQAQAYEEWKKSPGAKKDAEAWNDGLPLSGLIRGRGAKAEQQLQFIKDYAAEIKPEGNRAQATEDYAAALKAMNGFGDGKHGDIVRSFNVAYDHADLVGNLAKALKNGDVQKVNQLSQAYETEFGSAAPTNFDAAKHILADEINKAAIGGAGALADRQALSTNITNAASEDQIDGQLSTYKSLIVGQMKGIKRQYEQSTKRKDFERLLSPEVAADLKRAEAETPADSSGAVTSKTVHWDDLP